MENGWIKYLPNGKTIWGFDREVNKGTASWSKGETKLVGAKLQYPNSSYSLLSHLPNDFWQSDDFSCKPGHQSLRLSRRIEVFCREESFIELKKIKEEYKYTVIPTWKASSPSSQKLEDMSIPPNKWVVLEVNEQLYPRRHTIYLSDKRI